MHGPLQQLRSLAVTVHHSTVTVTVTVTINGMVLVYNKYASYFSCYTWFKLQINISNTLTDVESLWETLFSIRI